LASLQVREGEGTDKQEVQCKDLKASRSKDFMGRLWTGGSKSVGNEEGVEVALRRR
jgi:hypothetical protein